MCMRQYKDDLLASCLQLLLSLPKQLVELEIEDLVPALQVSTHTPTERESGGAGYQRIYREREELLVINESGYV